MAKTAKTVNPEIAREVELSFLFQALGHATRRQILDRLSQRPQSVTELAEPLGISLTAVGQHVWILTLARLVHTDKMGRVRTCRIDPAGFAQLEQWIGEHRAEWERKPDRLGEMLAEE